MSELILYLGVYRIESQRDVVVIARSSSTRKEELETKCEKVLKKIIQTGQEKPIWSFDSKKDQYTLHCNYKPSKAENLTFFAVTKLNFPNRPTALFKDFVDEFLKADKYSQYSNVKEGGLTRDMAPVFKRIQEVYGRDKLQETKDKVDVLKDKLHDNMQGIIERGEQLDEIKINAEELDADAQNFQGTAKGLKWKYCCANAKWTIILVLTLATIFTLIVVVAVCTTDPDACKS
mmetsp:Transcript_12730/g.19068  ORF Transcript_12730/g.19068 Transcript_12730/m.19068 type:complete len:233 (+) Transcript_12730:85-783(+)